MTLVGHGAAAQAEAPWRSLPLVENGEVHPDWKHVGWGGFSVDDGALRTECAPEGLGLLVYAKEKFGNCQIRVVYKCENDHSNAGVFVRIDDGILEQVDIPGAAFDRGAGTISEASRRTMQESSENEEGPWFAVHRGYEVQIQDSADPIHRTGAIYSLAASSATPEVPPGEWRTMIITLSGRRVDVDFDDRRVMTFDPASPDVPAERQWYEPKREPVRPEAGYLGLQNHDPGDVVWFKEISVRPISDTNSRLHRSVELNIGESADVELHDGSKAAVKLLEVRESRDSVRGALRKAQVIVEVNGEATELVSGNYRLPQEVGGVQVDCPAVQGLYAKRDMWEDSWGLNKDVRLRLWPAGSPWLPPGEFVYPVRQRWFASATQMSNEPSHVDGGDAPTGRNIYYHSGLDIGGCEGLVEVVSACDGVVISSGGRALESFGDAPYYKPSGDYDYVYIVDENGWYFRYAHLKSIEPAIQPGRVVQAGQVIGLLGKEGSSGGWSHLHFDIKARQPSGKLGIEEGYAFLWEAYQREYRPPVMAVARPHQVIWAGESVTLDGSPSFSARGDGLDYEWRFTDGMTAAQPLVERRYDRPGQFSEILKVADRQGNVDYDFAVVLVIDRALDGKNSPTIHASYAPTMGIHPGDAVTFKVRTFFATASGETWDFGDGSPPVTVRSDGNADALAPDGYAETIHRFAAPGHYLVRVEQGGSDGATITARLHVHVED
jgi:murein DD-endopeptidase MepM/ murein hydrolase activator NlpD